MIREYNKKKIRELVNRFSNAKVCYEYDNIADMHLIEVKPEEVYDSEEFCDWLNDFYIESINLYPTEDITIFSEDEILKVENPQFVVEGELYENYNFATSEIKNNIKYSNSSLNVDDLFSCMFEDINAGLVYIEGETKYKSNGIDVSQSTDIDEGIYSLAA